MEIIASSIADLEARLRDLRQTASAPVDKVQLGFVEALLKRADGKSGSALHGILARAEAALQRYETRQKPETATNASPTQTSPLTTLLEQLERQARQTAGGPASSSLDELLAQAEPALSPPAVQRLTPVSAPAPVKKTRRRKKTAATIPAGPELKAMRKARQRQALDNARRLVDDMNALQPENPGPLNPQMLATRAITLMRDLSPAYLNRFLVLMDTLFWLEEGSEQEEARKSRQP